MKRTLSSLLLLAIWHTLHLIYETVSRISKGLKDTWKTLKRIVPKDEKKEIRSLSERVKTFQKVPKHLAFSVVSGKDEVLGHQEKLKLVDEVAQKVAWAYAVNLRMVSLYDPEGMLKTLQGKLRRAIQKEVTRIKSILRSADKPEKEVGVVKELQLVRMHSVNGNGNIKEPSNNGLNNEDLPDPDGETLHVYIFSREDGKEAIIEAAKDIYLEKFKDNGNGKTGSGAPQVTEKMMDTYINRRIFGGSFEQMKVSTEPDLLMVFGEIKSTLGFLPWHVRLTEIHWMPKIHKADLGDFLGSLMKYSGCQQRFGK